MHSFVTIKNLKIAIALTGVNLLFSTLPALAQNHHSSPTSSTQDHKKPVGGLIQHYKVPTLSTKEFIVESFVNQGLEKADKQDYQGAVEAFNKALRLNPAHERGNRYRGEVLVKVNDYEGAIKNFSEAIKSNPTFSYLYVRRGEAYFATKNYQQAIQDYTKALELYPEDGIGYTRRGTAYFQLGDHKKAIADLNKAIELNSGRGDAYLNRGHIYIHMANLERDKNKQQSLIMYKKALVDYQQAAKLFDEQGYMPNSLNAMELIQEVQQKIDVAVQN